VTQAEQMGDDMPAGGMGGMPFGHHGHHRHGGHGGMNGGMSQDDAQAFFSQFFGGGDPFGSMGGQGGHFMGGHPGMRGSQRGSQRMQQDPYASMFGGTPGGLGGMPGGMGGMQQGFGGGSFRQQPREKRYDAIPEGTIVSLKNLVSRPEKNGDRGKVEVYDSKSGRYIVVLEDTEETMKVKPSNLLQHVHVKLHGLESKPEWNGEKATIIAWDQKNERYNVYVMGLSKAMGLLPLNVILEDGTVGMITGLQSKPELNGKFGTIKKFNSDSGRYDVQLSAEKILRLKLENIHV
jgi:hypothetical protein